MRHRGFYTPLFKKTFRKGDHRYYLGRLEAHLELFAASEGRQHHIVQSLVSPCCVRYPLKIDKGISQGPNAGRKNCSICDGPKLGEDAPD